MDEKEHETAKKPTSNRSAKMRRNTLFSVLDGVLSLSHRKIHSEGNSDKDWELIEICEADPDYSEKMSRYGAEGYQEYKYNRTTGRHYLRKAKNVW